MAAAIIEVINNCPNPLLLVQFEKEIVRLSSHWWGHLRSPYARNKLLMG